MSIIPLERKKAPVPVAILLSTLLTVPFLNSCGGGSRNAAPPSAVNDNVTRNVNDPGRPQARKGLTTGQKVAILGGAAALWYLYNRHKNAQGTGPEGTYYRSKNGGIYYRDAQGRPHFVSAPSEGIRVPESEAQQYQGYQGYNGTTSGRTIPAY
jgi:hypothetical protein